MSVLVPIGDFSRMTHLSVKALRFYHDQGLLEPARIDPATGYRFYHPRQVPVAQVIRRFRDLDMPLDQVKAVLQAPDVGTRTKEIIAHLSAMEAKLAEMQMSVASLRALLEGPAVRPAVEFRSIPAATALAVRGTVSVEEAWAWGGDVFGELYGRIGQAGLAPAGPGGALFPAEFFELEQAELTAFVPVNGSVPGGGRAESLTIPAVEAAVMVHSGPAGDTDQTYGALGTVVARAGDRRGGPDPRVLPGAAQRARPRPAPHRDLLAGLPDRLTLPLREADRLGDMTATRTPTSSVQSPPGTSWAALTVLMFGTFMFVLDFFIVNVALPSIQQGLRAGESAIEWVVAGYAISTAVLLVTGGRLGDQFGRRRVFALGMALFVVTSAACALAPDPAVLVAARVAQGVGAALMAPNILSILGVVYTGPDRVRAISVYGMVMGLAATSGQLIGGVLIRSDLGGLGWRAIFWINVPLGVVALVACPRLVPESRADRGSRLTWPELP